MGAFASGSKWRWTWGSSWKVSTFQLAAVSQGTQSSDLISSKCSHPRSLLLVQVTLKRSPAGALGPSWWDVIVCQSSFLKNEKRFKCLPAGISVSGSQSKGACRLDCCLKCRGEKNGWALRQFVLCHGGGEWQWINTHYSLFPFQHPSNGRVFLQNILDKFL